MDCHRAVAIVLLIFLAVYVFIYVSSDIEAQDSPWTSNLRSPLARKTDSSDDFDSTCSGYTYGEIKNEQSRILASVRNETIEVQAKLDEKRAEFEEYQRLIPQKQLELAKLEGELEVKIREMQEQNENRNVRVFLPHAPIPMPSVRLEEKADSDAMVLTIDDVLDYSRCSITSFMPVHVEVHSSELSHWKTAFEETNANLVESSSGACINIVIVNGSYSSSSGDRNTIVFNIGEPVRPSGRAILVQSHAYRKIDIAVTPDIGEYNKNQYESLPQLLPYTRPVIITYLFDKLPLNDNARLLESANKSGDTVSVVTCDQKAVLCTRTSKERESQFASSMFCVLSASPLFSFYMHDALRQGCVPIVLSSTSIMPFEEVIDWRLASYRLPAARLPEVHFILRSFHMTDVLEMRRKGRGFLEKYLIDRSVVAQSLISVLRHRLQIPTYEVAGNRENKAVPLFEDSFTSPKSTAPNPQHNFDGEYQIGPFETRAKSPTYQYNFTVFQMYAYERWNLATSPHETPSHLITAVEPPSETEFHPDSNYGFRPIEPGSGVEFGKALGGNRQREQFTVVLLTYERDKVLAGALERLNQLPFLNKVIVIWNNVDRQPPDAWPSLHVPVEFIRVSENSLNNRFVPWDRIETEAVLSLDDDIDLMQQELVFAFRVWRENRDRIVGFPARYHARYGDSMFYNSNHTCQMSIILTGAAFIHKAYLEEYTYNMPRIIREHVDKVKNCEDIAMNYLVSHITRRPPIKTTSRWTLKCPNCTDSLWQSGSHFEERHECMRLFTKIYGYNPLRYSQFRADSILFKTRVPDNHQKCFNFV